LSEELGEELGEEIGDQDQSDGFIAFESTSEEEEEEEEEEPFKDLIDPELYM
jgi:hypothetical protein